MRFLRTSSLLRVIIWARSVKAHLSTAYSVSVVNIYTVSSLDEYGRKLGKLGTDGTYPVAQALRIDPRRLMSKLLHVFDVRPRIDSGMTVRTAFTTQFQHA